MKSGLVKRILAMGMMVMMLSGDVLPVMAETVSGGDAVVAEQDVIVDAQINNTDVNVDSEETEEVETITVEETVTDETTTVSGGDVIVDDADVEEEIADTVSGGDLVEIEDEEVPLSDFATVTLEPVTVDGVTITVSGPAAAFAEGTTVSAVAVEPAEVVIEAAEENEQATVKKYKAFDINLVLNGEFVQPLNGEQITVNFEGDMLIPDVNNNEDVAVYHVDENDNVTKMEAEVVSVENAATEEVEVVEMTTTHFSTYVVVVTGTYEGKVKVTINHYVGQGQNKTKIFLTDENISVDNGGNITGFNKYADFYDVEKVTISDSTGKETQLKIENIDGNNKKCTINVNSENATLNVYYKEKTATVPAGVTMFDYVNGSATNSNSINYYKNYNSYKKYSSNDNTDRNHDQQNNWSKRFATISAAGDYNVQVHNDKGNRVNANAYNGNYDTQIIKGLLQGVSGTDYSEVNFTYEDPGFFTMDTKTGKKIIDGYEVTFNRTGINYELYHMVNTKNQVVYKNDGQQFFPLKNEDRLTGENRNSGNYNSNNEYFGMRYDFDFTIGDYVGDMTYTFSGDDDLWVCLDGKVILDLGGIHGEVQGSVNIWAVLIGKNNPTYADKVNYLKTGTNKTDTHTVTVLFMERGGSKSNCKMNFVMPSVVPKDPVITNIPKADLELVKKEVGTEEVISGVGFTLYSDAECKTVKVSERKTGDDGRVSFTGLREGTYYLKETLYDDKKYLENDAVYTVKVTVSGETATATVAGLDKDGNAYVVYNTPIPRTALEFYKVDRHTHAPLEDVKFTLKKDNKDGELIGEAVSAKDGYFKFEGIAEGTYYLEEDLTTVPEGYMAPERGWTIKVEEKDGVLSYQATDYSNGLYWHNFADTGRNLVKNEPYVSAEFVKKDSTTKEALSGVEFKLYKGNNNKKETLVATVVSDAEGKVKFDGLLTGQTYLLVETTPEGYVEVETPWILKVEYTDNQFVTKLFDTTFHAESNEWRITGEVYKENVIENTPAVGALTINKTVDKVDEVHGNATFTFKVTCPDGSILYRTITFEEAGSKSVTISNLPCGDYKVDELTSIRYTLDTDRSDENELRAVTANGNTQFDFYNDKTYEGNFSHTDVVVNKVVFNKDANGNIESVKSITNSDKTSTSDVLNN